ncbi:MAG: methionyl-tRNA formyltransferase [Bacteroidota bacterium]
MPGKPKIVFMGTPGFAVASLDALVKNQLPVVGVITAPDKPAGRGLEMHASPVKQYALEKGLRLLQPDKLKNEAFLAELRSLGADLFIVVAFRMLPEAVWGMPRLGTFNLHASLLPHYRGAAPINWAIINGEKETGVTTFFLQQEIDTGKIILQEKVKIAEDETAGELHDKLMQAGAALVLRTVELISTGNVPQTDQAALVKSGEELRPAPKIFREDCRIVWHKPIDKVYDLIRGLSPYPAAYTELLSPEGKKFQLKLFRAEKLAGMPAAEPGSIRTDGRTFLHVAAAGGYIAASELQLAGKKRMTAAELLRGFPLNDGWKAL